MATPLKAGFLLSPKVLSPLNHFSSPVINTPLVRRLQFSYPERNKSPQVHKIPIQIRISEHSGLKNIPASPSVCDSLLINTPNKINLLQNGYQKTKTKSEIGRGSFGTVIRGKYKNEIVAVKIVKSSSFTDQLNELNSLNLNHENLVKTIDVITKSEGFSIILMEYCHNSTNLQHVLNDPDFNVNDKIILKFAKDIVNGINYCHENKILHLDLKPANILVVGENVCKICDFGNSAKISKDLKSYKFKGTVAYAAPEILIGKCPTIKSDVYSLGIIFWQLRSRSDPYEGLHNEVVIYKVVKFDFRPQSEIDDNFSKLYASCWQKNPEFRPELHGIKQVLCNIL